MKIKYTRFNLIFIFSSVVTFIYAVYIRFQDLGYSEFQGDETNAIRYLGSIYGKNPDFGTFYHFLLNQKRGPGQYVINYINTSVFGLINEFQIRFPFFLFSVLALFSFYLLAFRVFKSKKVAILTSLLVATNGLYIAFSRITQYQSFMYFLIPLSLSVYILGMEKRNFKIVSFSGFLFSICLLTHYDTLGVGAFFVGYLLYRFYQNHKDFKFLLTTSALFLAFFLLPSVTFYLQFIRGAYYEESTSGYLTKRLFGFGLMPRTIYEELGKLLLLYMPIEGWLLSFLFFTIGLLSFTPYITKIKLIKIKISQNYVRYFYVFMVLLHFVALYVSVIQFKPRISTLLIYITSIFIISILFLCKKMPAVFFGMTFWSVLVFAIYFFFIKDPRTHVYMSFMPMFLISAYGLSNIIFSKLVYVRYTSFIIFFSFIFYVCSFYYVIFVNKNPEYPWFQKSLYGRDLYEVERARHRKIDGVFGFNNQRHWREISELFKKGCLKGNYSSNEKDSITKFYLSFSQTYPTRPGLIGGADNLIYIQGPNSWYYQSIDKLKADIYYSLIKTYDNGDYTVTYIFGNKSVYPNGKMLCDK